MGAIMSDLLSQAASADFVERAISPKRELGAYEALWAREGAWFKSIAETFGEHPGSVPSDFVAKSEIEKYARLALGAIREAGIRHFGVRVHGAGDYPQTLRDADHPVELLYFQGAWELVNTRCVALVGTRDASDDGKSRAANLARLLVGDGFTVVAGLARGIDTVAHTAAMEAGGFTIAVLGTPITECYPPENKELQRQIADQHLVISQIPIVRYAQQHFRSRKHFFPERNVTMSALTEATIIVEAGETSGTLVQARHALKQNRKLFILDSCFSNSSLSWPANFEKQGAIRVSDYDDIKRHLASSNSTTNAADR
jgi:DNA processing protein